MAKPVPENVKIQKPASIPTLGKLYTRLDQTAPGSKESKQIAEEIINRIG
jgi:hypothetical protein